MNIGTALGFVWVLFCFRIRYELVPERNRHYFSVIFSRIYGEILFMSVICMYILYTMCFISSDMSASNLTYAILDFTPSP